MLVLNICILYQLWLDNIEEHCVPILRMLFQHMHDMSVMLWMQVLWSSVDIACTLDDWSALQFNMKIHPLESDQYTQSLCIYVQNMQMCIYAVTAQDVCQLKKWDRGNVHVAGAERLYSQILQFFVSCMFWSQFSC